MKFYRKGVVIALLFGAFGHTTFAQEQDLQLQGVLKESSSEYVYLHRFENKMFTVIDSAQVKKGEFSFTKKLPLPDLYGLSDQKGVIPFYVFLDSGKSKVTLYPNDNARTEVIGSSTQTLFDEYRAAKVTDIKSFIKKYPDELVSSYVLYREWSYRLSPDEIDAAIALLSPAQQQSRFTKDLKKIVAIKRSVDIGKKAPAIVGNDTSGRSVSLYDELKEYTLIDFWASWCPPCRAENPNIVANYKKYKDQGFGIFAVSLDKTKEAWLKGIADDHLTWTHVSELRFWDSEIANAYAVRAIPTNFLVDQNGIIVAKDIRGERLGSVLDSLFHAKQGTSKEKKPFIAQDPITFVSTVSKALALQDKRTQSPDGVVFFSNEFDGARLNAVAKAADGAYELHVDPENQPINGSSWYAFKVWAKKDTTVQLRLNYSPGYGHRYHPKINQNGEEQWHKLGQEVILSKKDSVSQASFSLSIGTVPHWVAAQENVPSSKVYAWLDQHLETVSGEKKAIGKTTLGRPLFVYGIGNKDSKKAISVLGRQHPPEITGHYAYEAFVNYLLGDSPDAKQFREDFYIYLLPVLNPDGVDLGQWRNNGGGVDLNRDWHEFHQPESRAVRDFFKNEFKGQHRKLYFSVDFHSTGSDIYYTVDAEKESILPGLIDDWLSAIVEAIPSYELKRKALYLGGPTYTAYSYLFDEYGTESLVYEIGDDTPRDFITKKANVSAQKLIELLRNRLD